jgi:hypothetical protein
LKGVTMPMESAASSATIRAAYSTA